MSLMVDANAIQDQDGSSSNSPVQANGPAVLLPHEAIGNVVTKTNTLIIEHREWLANLPQRKERERERNRQRGRGQEQVEAITSTSTSTSPPTSLITPAPRYRGRQIVAVLPDCTAVSSSLASEVASVSSTCEVRIASLQAALLNAESAFASAQSSAAIALSTASVSGRAIISVSISVSSSASVAIASAQSAASSSVASAIASASSSASLAIAAGLSSAQSSASRAIASAQSSASVSILSANNALTSVQISANRAVASASAVALSANDAASQARATASLAIQSAQASVEAAQQSASATRVAAMNTTILALTITFSVLGSSLISILIYYLISRCRRRRRERKQSELKEKIHRIRHESDESLGPSLSAFPMPVGRSKWMSRGSAAGSRERSITRDRSGERGMNSTMRRPDTMETAQITGGTAGTGMLSGSATLLNPTSQPGSAQLLSAGGNGQRGDDRERRTWAPNARIVSSRGEMDFAFGGSPSQDGRRTWAARETIPEERDSASFYGDRDRESERRPTMVRKNTLTYDPEHPDRPPKFTTWLEESFRSVSPFPNMDGEISGMERVTEKGKGRRSSYFGSRGDGTSGRESLMQRRRRSKSLGEISDIGTAF